MRFHKTKFIFLFLFSLIALLTFPGNVSALQMEVFDTIAGFDTLARIQSFGDELPFVLNIQNPQKEIFRVSVDKGGSVEISGSYLKKAGIYQGRVSDSEGNSSENFSFEVFPGDPSPTRSGIYPDRSKATMNRTDRISVNVRLQDEFANSISGHEIALVSSRSQDLVFPQGQESSVTDENGLARFWISSSTPGISTLQAFDRTQGVAFSKRSDVKFTAAPFSFSFGQASILGAVGGDDYAVSSSDSRFLSLANGTENQSGAVAKFELKDTPSSVAVNQNFTFKLRALSSDDFVVPEYRGTVKFSSPTDLNAIFPSDYTFLESDLGEHTFELALSFKSSGKQKLVVQEKDNPTVKGEIEIEVEAARPAASDEGVRLTLPTSGKYSKNVFAIEGEAPSNSSINIFDNGQQIGVTRSSSSGKFSFTTPKLKDGQHVFSAETGGTLSEEVTVTVDATTSQVEKLTLTPNPAAPDQSIAVELTSEKNLKTVSVTMNQTVVDLTESRDEPGVYRGTLNAPKESGNYPIDVQLIDASGNEATLAESGALRVDSTLSVKGSTFRVPSRVNGVQASPMDKKVKLAWQSSTDDTGIQNYRIYFGINRALLDQSVNTADARTVWEVRDLKNGVQYFFQMVGVDTDGHEGDQKSAVVGAVPNGRGEVLKLSGEEAGYPSQLPEDGPGMGILLFSPLIAYFVRKFQKRT